MLPAMLAQPATLAHYLGPAGIDLAGVALPLAGAHARLGFPSPAEDYLDDTVDLNQLLIRNAPATFLYRAEGWSMLMAGICDGDILVIDRSVRCEDGDLVIAIWEGNQPTCKVLKMFEHHLELHSANPDHAPIVLEPGTEVEVFAVVGVARQMRRRKGRVRAR